MINQYASYNSQALLIHSGNCHTITDRFSNDISMNLIALYLNQMNFLFDLHKMSLGMLNQSIYEVQ